MSNGEPTTKQGERKEPKEREQKEVQPPNPERLFVAPLMLTLLSVQWSFV
jgi:hypothetical protein